ncbi:MAG: bifunctional [glutamate--ammonia ligase]-adenylyl-L-tyrosine phosphorylase/[glutamate--ammonia-ligase] adenylyltransferase [Nitrospirae bacterium]|nr:bifunctional [glutamate--ammonia ligase]-adenylyl-L-tyrosine phosphorylase/[glutamate--ammonia-ligase] adenylyltransferase [Nitrospirota bacterium]
MAIDGNMLSKISGASAGSSDPERAEKNLQRFYEKNAGAGLEAGQIEIAARLFAASQFLANYSIAFPDELFSALKAIDKEITPVLLKEAAATEIIFDGDAEINDITKILRYFRKRHLLRITLRDIEGKTDIKGAMAELTLLAEVIIEAALNYSLSFNKSRFGEPESGAIALIALGKLGGEELNYSSDVDLMAVYGDDEGQTSGIKNPSGVVINRISNHEFYCKVVELFSRLLSAQTEDGIAFRVDLRLRPQGQKGDIALPLKAYRTYYESWGRTWERMALIRARPVAGDKRLGAAFMGIVEKFAWRETLDYSDIEEIRGLKKSMDSAFSSDDIKRGYGGIREAEFFVQTFQLLYAAKKSSLKVNRMIDAIDALREMKMIPDDELQSLKNNYLCLRRVEHYLQMKEDLQTHDLPSSDEDLNALAMKTGFSSSARFLADMKSRRMQIKTMYNSLLGTSEDKNAETLNLLEGDIKDHELAGYLLFKKARRPEESLVKLKKIREHMLLFRTMQERSLLRKVMPPMLEEAFASENPDNALAGIESLLTSFRIERAHLTALGEQKELMTGIIKIFALSSYLSGIFLSSPYYLNILIEEWAIFKTLKSLEDKLRKVAAPDEDTALRLARFRRLEELRLGMLFLQGILPAEALFRDMTYLAEAIINAVAEKHAGAGLSVIALGKFGGREMTFGSDLDIIFVSGDGAAGAAEKIMKSLTSYTDAGMLYSVDARLRPDGSKGSLVKDIKGYRDYYLAKAHPWELQALLRARPVAGDPKIGKEFLSMASEAIRKRGSSLERDEVLRMRAAIIRELARESEGIDIKLGPGGTEEIEFFVQYLILHNAGKRPEILVQNMPAAIKRLAAANIISAPDKDALLNAHEYLRKLETLIKLNGLNVLPNAEAFTETASLFMGHKKGGELTAKVQELRKRVTEIINRIN